MTEPNPEIFSSEKSIEVYHTLVDSLPFFEHHPSPKYGRTFQPRSQDVFIATYPKCGTTWATQICHQLRSNGDMDFKEIAEVAPWDIFAQTLNQDLDADQKFVPRIFKSHETYDKVAKGAKYVVVLRDPFDAFSSYYKFISGIRQFTLEEYSLEQFFHTPSPWGVLSAWFAGWYKGWKNGEVNVLWVFYEDLKSSTAEQVARIAKFMDIGEDVIDSRIEVALKQSSIEFMAKHDDKFNEALVMAQLAKQEGADGPMGEANKVAKGKVGAGKVLPEKIVAKIKAEWKQNIEDTFGFKDYAEFKKAVQS